MLKWSWGWWQNALLSFNPLRYSFEPVYGFLLWFVSLLYLLPIQNWHGWYVPELSQSSASQHHGWVSPPIASRNVTQKVRSQILYFGMPEIFGHTIICLSILHTIRSWKSDLAVMAACMALLFVMVNILWAMLTRLWLYSSSLYCLLNCCGEYALHCKRSVFLWNITMHFTVWWSFPLSIRWRWGHVGSVQNRILHSRVESSFSDTNSIQFA